MHLYKEWICLIMKHFKGHLLSGEGCYRLVDRPTEAGPMYLSTVNPRLSGTFGILEISSG